MRTSSILISGAVAAVAVAGAASANVTVNFATAPNPSTYDTSLIGPGTSSSWLTNGWSAGQGAWQLSAPAAGGLATFNMAASSFVPAGTSLSQTYATGTFRYSATSNIPSPGQPIFPSFVFSVSIASANDAQITVGNIVSGGASPYYALERDSGDWGNAIRGRESVGFQLGWAAGNIVVSVSGNRAGLSSGFAEVGGTTTWNQLMAASTGPGGNVGQPADHRRVDPPAGKPRHL